MASLLVLGVVSVEMDCLSHLLKYLDFWRVTFQIKGILLCRTVAKFEISALLGSHAVWSKTSWLFKMGMIGCSETLVQNYHSTLCKISEECRSHKARWKPEIMHSDKILCGMISAGQTLKFKTCVFLIH